MKAIVGLEKATPFDVCLRWCFVNGVRVFECWGGISIVRGAAFTTEWEFCRRQSGFHKGFLRKPSSGAEEGSQP